MKLTKKLTIILILLLLCSNIFCVFPIASKVSASDVDLNSAATPSLSSYDEPIIYSPSCILINIDSR